MLPQSFARQYVEVDASRSFGKYGTGQGNMPLQYKGVIGACLLRKFAQGHGTCDVGGAAVVLAPGIDEVESFGLQFNIAFFIYTVMYNGAVPGITGDGAEGFAYESRSEEHTSELQSRPHLVCRLLLEKKKEQSGGSTAHDCLLYLA